MGAGGRRVGTELTFSCPRKEEGLTGASGGACGLRAAIGAASVEVVVSWPGAGRGGGVVWLWVARPGGRCGNSEKS